MSQDPPHALEAGSTAPDFELRATPDQFVKLSDRHLVVVAPCAVSGRAAVQQAYTALSAIRNIPVPHLVPLFRLGQQKPLPQIPDE